MEKYFNYIDFIYNFAQHFKHQILNYFDKDYYMIRMIAERKQYYLHDFA